MTAAIGARRVPRPLHSGHRSLGNGADSSGRLSVTSHTVPADSSLAVLSGTCEAGPCSGPSTCGRPYGSGNRWFRPVWRPESSPFPRTSGSVLHSHPECSTRPCLGYPPHRRRCTGRRPDESPAVARRSPSCRRPWCCTHRCLDGTPILGRRDRMVAFAAPPPVRFPCAASQGGRHRAAGASVA